MSILVFACTVLAAPAAAAQLPGNPVPITVSQGMWTGSAVGVQVARQSGTSGDRGVLMRTPGITSGSLGVWDTGDFGDAGPDHPSYHPSALFGHWILPTNTAWVNWGNVPVSEIPVLGGMSTGGDVCPPVDSDGVLMMNSPAAPWLSLSLVAGSGGVPTTLIGDAPGGPRGNIFSYGVEGSTGILPQFIDANRVEYTRGQMGLGGAAPKPQITALDWGMGDISAGPNGQGSFAMQPRRDLFFFTLDPDWVTHFTPVSAPTPFVLDATVIYAMTWNGAQWSQPFIAMELDDLLGPNSINVLEIDAISIHAPEYYDAAATPPPLGIGDPQLIELVVFSLNGGALNQSGEYYNEILVTQPDPSISLQVLGQPLQVDTSGGPMLMTDKVGLVSATPGGQGDQDPVRGLCNRDPHEASLISRTIGYPITNQGPVPPTIGVSLYRYGVEDTTTVGNLMLNASGIDLQGYLYPLVAFEVEVWRVGATSAAQFGATEFTAPQWLPSHTDTVYDEVLVLSAPGNLPRPLAGLPGVQLRVRALTGGIDPFGVLRIDTGVSWQSWITLR